MLKDDLGLALTGATADARDAYTRALDLFRLFRNDPVATLAPAIEQAPGFTMAHVMRAWLLLLATDTRYVGEARASIAAAERSAGTPRERAHVAAARAMADGKWFVAGRLLEDIAIDEPRDILALLVGQQVDFFTGAARMLRDRIARAMPAWDPSMPGWHTMLSMHAFGLEETGDYAGAERSGRRAVELEPRDGWGQHAVAHVMEMQGRQRDGIAWMRAAPEAWSTDSFMAVHNWWHLAMFHLELGEIDEVLALFDAHVGGAVPQMTMDFVDASSMLWRLRLRGIDVGQRWTAIADHWKPFAASSDYAFNDFHAVMAFLGASRRDDVHTVLERQAATMAGTSDNAFFTREVGNPACRALVAFEDGAFGDCARLLRDIRNGANRFGGSHAQRDVIDLTLVEAALRGGETSLAAALIAERLALKAQSPHARALAARVAMPARAA